MQQKMAPQGDDRRWLRRQDWWSWDLWLGAAAATAVIVLYLLARPRNGDATENLFLVLIGLDAALLAAVLAVMAIFAAFISRPFRRLLAALPGGLERALATYRITAMGAAVVAIVTILATLWISRFPNRYVAIATGLIVGGNVWLLIGTAQLVQVTINHITDSALWEDAVDRGRSMTTPGSQTAGGDTEEDRTSSDPH